MKKFVLPVLLFALVSQIGLASYVIPNNGVTTAKIADGAVTKPKLSSLGQQISSSSGTDGTGNTGTSYSAITNLSVTITTSGRPVLAFFVGDNSGNGGRIEYAGSATSVVAIFRASTEVASYAFVPASVSLVTGSGGIVAIDTPAAGTYTYTGQYKSSAGASSVFVRYTKLVAYEL